MTPPAATPRLRFDFADTLGLTGPVCFERPVRVIVARDLDEVRPAMRAVEEGLREGLYAAGFVSYEAAAAFDDALTAKPSSDLPLLWFGLFREPDVPPRDACGAPDAHDAPVASDAPAAQGGRAVRAGCQPSALPLPLPAWTWEPDITPGAYQRGIDDVKRAIARGDTYQVNYTFRLRARLDSEESETGTGTGPPVSADALDDLYLRLARAHRAPYSASLDLGRWRILSLSPELFFRLRGGRITTRPMKGTAARGRWPAEDEAQAAWLEASEKNRAENVMIVDLARNDVGRIAEVGSVEVSRLFEVERYPSVFQMVSTVEGRVREQTTLTEVFAALFPAGSITGAPKSSSMAAIAAIEHSPRGVYCGAIGFVTPAGDAVFNVAIRTAVIDTEAGRAEYGVGGGITWDSTVTSEYAEALSKAAALSVPPAFELLETMRLEGGVYGRRARHVRRVSEAAAYFDVPIDVRAIDAALDDCAQSHPTGAWRVRLLVSPTGHPRVQATPLDPTPGASAMGTSSPPVSRAGASAAAPNAAGANTSDANATGAAAARVPAQLPIVALARTPISRDDRFLYHKTTNRAVYEAHRAAQAEAFDVLLWNEARELTEFTIGNLVIEIDGERVTPPRGSGLLAGTLRGELLDAGTIRERVLTIDDLSSASRIWLLNSVRGWVEVTLRRD